MIRLFLLHTGRYWARHKTLTALNIVGIALGVTVFLSIQIVNHSALQSFRASVDIVAGKANLEVIGNGLRFDEKAYPLVVNDPDVLAATPTVEDVASLTDFPGDYLQILGIDIFSDGALRTFELRDAAAQKTDVFNFLRDPKVIALTRALCDRLHLKIGDSIRLQTQNGTEEFRIGFLLDFGSDAPGADEHLAVMDIANVQENFRHLGELSRISALLRPGADFAAVQRELSAKMPGNALVQAPDRRGRQIERMIGAFQLNLTALSLISLLAGMFLIYNTVAAAVVRRRYEIGVLRALGLSGNQVQAMFLIEAFLLGLGGLFLGLIFGVILASQLIGIVSKTITSLYILTSIHEIFISPVSVLLSIGLTFGAVLAAAWWPAREAARISPVEALQVGHLQEKSVRLGWIWTFLAGVFAAITLVLSAVSLRFGPAWLSFGAALFALLAFAFLVPLTARLFVLGLSALVAASPRWVLARLALSFFARSLHRNSITIAALVVAIAMVVGISTMIFSFRQTVQAWLNRAVQADIMIAPAANLLIGHREIVRPEVEPIVRATPGLHACDTFRELRPRFRGDTIKLIAFDMPIARDLNRFSFSVGDPVAAFDACIARDAVIVSEPFSRRFHLDLNDFLPLDTPEGRHNFRIVGVYQDYTTEGGVVLVNQATYHKFWHDTEINGLALYLDANADAARIQNQLRDQLAPYGDFIIKSNREIRTEVFRIFDQTFSVTYVLQTIGLIISGLGIFLSLTILVNERRREISILRAVGATGRQIQTLVLLEAGLIGLIGSFLGLIAGLVLAAILSNVINVAFFGWTIAWAWPWPFLSSVTPLVLLSALIAGYGPARQAARLNIADGVKME